MIPVCRMAWVVFPWVGLSIVYWMVSRVSRSIQTTAAPPALFPECRDCFQSPQFCVWRWRVETQQSQTVPAGELLMHLCGWLVRVVTSQATLNSTWSRLSLFFLLVQAFTWTLYTPGTRGWSRLRDRTLAVQQKRAKIRFFSRKKKKYLTFYFFRYSF